MDLHYEGRIRVSIEGEWRVESRGERGREREQGRKKERVGECIKARDSRRVKYSRLRKSIG